LDDISGLYATSSPGRIRNQDLIDTTDVSMDLDDGDEFQKAPDWKNHLKATM
jgi:hypothetical protein